MNHFSPAYYSCLSSLRITKPTAWQVVYHLTRRGPARGQQYRGNLTFRYLYRGKCQGPEMHRRTNSLETYFPISSCLFLVAHWTQALKTKSKQNKKRSLLFPSSPFLCTFTEALRRAQRLEVYFLDCKEIRWDVFNCGLEQKACGDFFLSPNCYSFSINEGVYKMLLNKSPFTTTQVAFLIMMPTPPPPKVSTFLNVMIII